MTHSSSLAGHWRLVVEGSDCIPGLHVAEGAPFSAMITKGNFTEEYLHIRQAVSSKGDETFLTYWSAKGSTSITATYEIGSINFDTSFSSPILGVIIKADRHFHELGILRLGPKQGQCSTESFRLDKTGQIIVVNTELTTKEGQKAVFTKYFHRELSCEIPRTLEYRHYAKTVGWCNPAFRSLDILETVTMAIIKSVSVGDHSAKRSAIGDKNDIAHIIGRHSHLASLTSNVVLYIIQVVQGSVKWFVGHRYSEFEALKRFITTELSNPSLDGGTSTSPKGKANNNNHLHQNNFQSRSGEAELVHEMLTSAPLFPEKRIGFMTTARLEQRRDGLEAYLNYFIDNKAIGSRNVCDALLSFLEIPQHLQAHDMTVQAARKKFEAAEAAQAAQRAKQTPAFQRVSLANFGSVSTTAVTSTNARHGSMSMLEKSSSAMQVGEKKKRPSVLSMMGLAPSVPPPPPPSVSAAGSGADSGGATTLSAANLQQLSLAATTRKRSDSGSSAGDSDSSTNSSYVTSSVPMAVLASRPSVTVPITKSPTTTDSGHASPMPDYGTKRTVTSNAVAPVSGEVTVSSSSPVTDTRARSTTSTANLTEREANLTLNKALSTPATYFQYPQDALFAVLQAGILVLKHGRTGKPKKRLLRCDHAVSRLYWNKPSEKSGGILGRRRSATNLTETADLGEDLPHESKSISLADVIRVRKGTDVDTEVADGNVVESSSSNSMMRRMSKASSPTGPANGKPLLGTATLRRSCKPQELELCFSLILPNRSFDIQCFNQSDYNLLFNNLERMCQQLTAAKS